MTDKELLEELADTAVFYYRSLRGRVPEELAQKLTVDWHYATVSCYASAGLMDMKSCDCEDETPETNTTMSA